VFYKQYLSKNKPMVVDDGCKSWRALEKWTDTYYLKREYNLQSIVINKLERPVVNG